MYDLRSTALPMPTPSTPTPSKEDAQAARLMTMIESNPVLLEKLATKLAPAVGGLTAVPRGEKRLETVRVSDRTIQVVEV